MPPDYALDISNFCLKKDPRRFNESCHVSLLHDSVNMDSVIIIQDELQHNQNTYMIKINLTNKGRSKHILSP